MVNLADLHGQTLEHIVQQAESSVVLRWHERIAARIANQMDRELREGCPDRLPDNEQAALAMIRSIARELEEAADALEQAAQRLKRAGDGVGAAQTMHMAKKKRDAARGLVGA